MTIYSLKLLCIFGVAFLFCSCKERESEVKDVSYQGSVGLENESIVVIPQAMVNHAGTSSVDKELVLLNVLKTDGGRDNHLTRKFKKFIESNDSKEFLSSIETKDVGFGAENGAQFLSIGELKTPIAKDLSNGIATIRLKDFPGVLDGQPLGGFPHRGCPIDAQSGLKWISRMGDIDKNSASIANASFAGIATFFSPDSITIHARCSIDASIGKDDLKRELELSIIGRFRVKFSQRTLLVPKSNPSYIPPYLDEHNTYVAGRGTRFFSLRNPELKKSKQPLMRWDLTNKIVIVDDINDTSGKPFQSFDAGLLIQKGLREGVHSVQNQLKPLRNRIVLKSQLTDSRRESANIKIGYLEDNGNTVGECSFVVDNETGEIFAGIISVYQSNLLAWRRQAETLAMHGLIENIEDEVKLRTTHLMVHELGHCLGLRHNFEGRVLDRRNGYETKAVMDYADIVPISLWKNKKLGFFDHDILSLKYLYAEQFGDHSTVRKRALEELMTMAMGPDEEQVCEVQTSLFPDCPDLQKIIYHGVEDFMLNYNHPAIEKFKARSPDLFHGVIKALY